MGVIKVKKKIIRNIEALRSSLISEIGYFGISNLSKSNFKDVLSPHFRLFLAINKDRNRYAQIASDFNFLMHSLSDSPISCCKHLGRNWEYYNNQIICHVSRCNFRCRYCYVDYNYLNGFDQEFITAKNIVKEFLVLREKFNSHPLNVLRISGGEPFLIPEFILEVLSEIRNSGLSNDVMVKCETNLSTFIPTSSSSLVERWVDLTEFQQFNNFIIHATIHGLDGKSLKENTGADPFFSDVIMNGLRILVENELDVYPSIGLNTNKLNGIENLFNSLINIHPNLPLRLSIRPFRFDYDNVVSRKIRSPINDNELLIYWDSLLRNHYNLGYLEKARCNIDLG